MGVQVNGHADVFLQLLHQRVSVIGQQQVCHVLDADGIRAHLLQLHSQLHEVLFAVHRALGVADSSFHHAAVLFDELHGSFHVPGIVQSVEDTHHVNAVLNGLLAESLYHVVSVVTIAQDVLAAEQHLQLGVGKALLQGAQALPGIFIQKAHAHVEGGAAPALQGPIPNAVQNGQDGDHVLDLHTGSSLGLVSVTQDGIHYLKGIFCHILSHILSL